LSGECVSRRFEGRGTKRESYLRYLLLVPDTVGYGMISFYVYSYNLLKHISLALQFRRLPLHIACQTAASSSVVQLLIDRYPDGARTKDALGRLPLHYACSHGAPVEVVSALLESFLSGAGIGDKNGW